MARKKAEGLSEAIHVRIKDQTAKKLKKMAKEKGVPFSIYVRMIVEEGAAKMKLEIDHEQKKAG